MNEIIISPAHYAAFPVALIISRFNEEVTQALFQGAKDRWEQLGFPLELITAVHVPGAIEIPVTGMHMAKSGRFSAIIALGAVIRGETTHYDYVCQQVSEGCQAIALTTGIPTIFGVLTTENEQQAFDRLGGAHGHKGHDAIDAACEMVAIIKQIK
jgi:6,7-dimethyl-8-ribityllumazine synthase